MRVEGFLADFVSTLVNDNGRGDVETRCLVPYIPASAHARSSTRSVGGCNPVLLQVLPRMTDLRRSSRVSSIIFQLLIIFLTRQSSSKSPMRTRSSKTRANVDGWTDPRRSGTVGSRWNTSSVELTMTDDVQKCLAVVAVQRRIEEEGRRRSRATAGYSYDYQQVDETAVRAHTQEAMEVDALASAMGH